MKIQYCKDCECPYLTQLYGKGGLHIGKYHCDYDGKHRLLKPLPKCPKRDILEELDKVTIIKI